MERVRGPATGEVTELLLEWSEGDDKALERLMPLVYRELRRIASRYLRGERRGHTLQTTGLVHEAFLRLVDQRRVRWHGELHFYALSARLMRRILVDHSRRRAAVKRGGQLKAVVLDEVPDLGGGRSPDFLAIDQALSRLEELDPELSRLVELRFFGGFKNDEVSDLLGISVPTITRRWRRAKSWMYRYLTDHFDYAR